MTALWVVLTLWLAAILERGLAQHIGIFGAHPDFLLLTSIVIGLGLRRSGAAMTGFLAGVIQGALIGANLSHYVISRVVAAFAAAWSRELRFEMNPAALALTIAALTILGRLTFMVTAGPKHIGGFLGDTMGTAIYNGVLAIPVYALLRRVLNPVVR